MSNEAIYVEIVIWVVFADKVNWVIRNWAALTLWCFLTPLKSFQLFESSQCRQSGVVSLFQSAHTQPWILVADSLLYKRLCPFIGRSVHSLRKRAFEMLRCICVFVWETGSGRGCWRWYIHPCPPVSDDTVTPHYLFFYVFAFSWTPQTNKRPS